MGKYMRKAKITGDVAVTDLSQSSLGVRTRARTLALQKLEAANSDSSCYLQLRNRRLEKTPKLGVKESCEQNPQVNLSDFDGGLCSRLRVVNSGPVGSGLIGCEQNEKGCFVERGRSDLGGDEDCFGENNMEVQTGESTRESTPCSLIKELDSIGNPGSSTRRPLSLLASDQQTRISMQQHIPTTCEMEEFLAFAEQQQQKLFTEKYNFDVLNDLPLPGRYEWVRVCP